MCIWREAPGFIAAQRRARRAWAHLQRLPQPCCSAAACGRQARQAVCHSLVQQARWWQARHLLVEKGGNVARRGGGRQQGQAARDGGLVPLDEQQNLLGIDARLQLCQGEI